MTRVTLARDNTLSHKGFGFAEFSNERHLRAALELSGRLMLHDRAIFIEKARERRSPVRLAQSAPWR